MSKPMGRETLHAIEAMVDDVARKNGAPITPTTFVSGTCDKRIYTRDGRRIVAYRKGPRSLGIKTANAVSEACWTAALAHLHTLELPLADKILDAYQRAFPQLWDDLDLGPASYVSCAADPAHEQYNETLTILLHELQHELRRDGCLFNATSGEDFCYALPTKLPGRALARLDHMPVGDPEERSFYELLQHMYLVDVDQPPLMLFDELDAYLSTARVWTAMLRKLGAPQLLDGKGHHMYLPLPLFALYSVRYLEALRVKQPKRYAEVFGPDTANRRTLMRLLDECGRAYDDWVAALAAVGAVPTEGERALWAAYLATRAQARL
jgi:hypothetical protein